MRRFLGEAFRYAMVSAVALAVDVGTLFFLYRALGMHYLVAAASGYCAGAVVAWWLCRRFVFSERRLQRNLPELLSFAVLGIVGLLLNLLIIRLAVADFGLPLLLAKLLAAACTFGCNFLLRRQLLFTAASGSRAAR